MSFDIVRSASGAALSRRDERAFSRELTRLETKAALRVGRVRAAEAVECAKVEALATVGAVAIEEAADLSALAELHARRSPQAAGRLHHVADQATLALGRRVRRFERSLG